MECVFYGAALHTGLRTCRLPARTAHWTVSLCSALGQAVRTRFFASYFSKKSSDKASILSAANRSNNSSLRPGTNRQHLYPFGQSHRIDRVVRNIKNRFPILYHQ